jgi:hypothetical protein
MKSYVIQLLTAFVAAGCPTRPDCEDAPLVTWETFGEGFIRGNCTSCHRSTASDRHDAPTGVDFDDYDAVMAWKDPILAMAGSEPPQMPPGGGTSVEERDKLAIWLTCWE